MRVTLALIAFAAPALGSCLGPPPSHALVVRHPERKCALIAFSGCGAFMSDDAPLEQDDDAGFEDDDAGVEAR